MDALTLASYVGAAAAAFAILSGIAGGAWRLYTWRRARRTEINAEISLGFTTFAAGASVIVTVRNPLDYPVNVTGVAVELNDGSRRVAVELWVHRGASIPGIVPPHGSGVTWFDYDQLVAGGLDPYKPVRARVTIAEREGFLWSPGKRLLKRD